MVITSLSGLGWPITPTGLDRALGGVLGVSSRPLASRKQAHGGNRTTERWGGGRRLLLGARGDLTAAGPPHDRRLHTALLPSPKSRSPGMWGALGLRLLLGLPGSGPPTPAAEPRIGLPGAPPGSGAPIGCRCPTPGAAAEADRWIGGPAAASSPWRRPCSPPRPGRPPGSPQLSPLFGLQPPPRSARAPAPPDPGLPLRCGKACPAPRRCSWPPRPSPGQAGPSRAGDRSPGPGGGQARGEGPCQRGRARRGHLRAAPRSARLWAQRRDAVTRDPLWDERRKVPGKPSGSQQE